MRSLLLFLLFIAVPGGFGVNAQVTHFRNAPNSTLGFRGNAVRFSDQKNVSVMGMNLKTNPLPIAINGEKVYNVCTEPVQRPVYVGPGKSLDVYLFEGLKELLCKLPDGTYSMNIENLCVDKKGRLVYFDYADIIAVSNQAQRVSSKNGPAFGFSIQQKPEATVAEVPDDLQKALNDRMYVLLTGAVRYKPGMLKRTPVFCYLGDDTTFDGFIVVSDHKATYSRL